MKLISPISGVIEQIEGRFGLKARLRVEFKANEPFELPDEIAQAYITANPNVYQKFTGQKLKPLVEASVEDDEPLVATTNEEKAKQEDEKNLLLAELTALAQSNPKEVFNRADELGIKYPVNIKVETLIDKIVNQKK